MTETVTVVEHTSTAGEGKVQTVGIVSGRGNQFAVHDAGAGERGSVVDVLDDSTCITAAAAVRLVRLADITGNAVRDGSGLGGFQVQVGTVVETLVLVAVVIGHVELLEQTALLIHTGTDKIAYPVGTAADVDVVLLLKGDVLHNVVSPLGVRETERVAAGTELLDDVVRECGHLAVVDAHLVVEAGIVVGRGLLDHLGGGKGRERQ